MMRRAALLLPLAFALLVSGPARTQVTLGRLFSTPAERAAMESTRGASAALAPNSQGQQPAPGTPGGPAADAGAPGAAPGPGQADGPGGRGADGNYTQGPSQPQAQAAPGAAGGAATNPPPPPPPELVMSGVLRRSDNRTTVWLNNEPQYGAQRSTSQKNGAATPDVTVTLPSGKKIILKAGQRYDLNQGRIKDINEP